MKRIVLPLAGLLMLGSSLAPAATTSTLEANIPFQFTAGEMTFTSGKYEIRTHSEATKSSLEMMNLATKKTATVDAKPAASKDKPRKTELVFHRYGDKEYLWMVNEGGSPNGLEVLTGKSEMALQKAGKKPTIHSQIATQKMMSQAATPSATQPASKPAPAHAAANPTAKPTPAPKSSSGTAAKTKHDQASKKTK